MCIRDRPWLPDVDGIYNDFSDRSLAPAQIYHWLHALNNLGIVDTTYADYPAAMVFKKDYHKNYVVDNSSDAELIVKFSDGEQVLAPANATIVKKVNTSSCVTSEEAITFNNESVVGTYIANTIQTQGTVNTANSTTFKAHEYVLLEAGFATGTNTDFLAIIEECEINTLNEVPVASSRSNNGTSAWQEKRQQVNLQLSIAPNPFSEQTSIQYQLPETGITTIQLLDILGRPVQVIKNELQASGAYQLVVDASNLEAGAYFLSIRQGANFSAKKLIKE